jgi:N-acetylglucosamine transport system permease protein
MQNTTEKSSRSAEGLYKFFIYFVLVLLAVTIIVPVAWVFMASIKQNAEFYGNPWALPAGFYWQNFVNAWNGAKMGEYMLNSVIVTALALALLLVVALPAAYCLSRFHFKGCKVLNTLFMAGLFINVNYIVVPIFLMLRDGDVWLKSHFGSSFLLNNLVVLAVVYAATALPFTIYLLSGYFATLPHDDNKTVVRCALFQRGVGGDNSWGATPHEAACFAVEKGMTFSFSIQKQNG